MAIELFSEPTALAMLKVWLPGSGFPVPLTAWVQPRVEMDCRSVRCVVGEFRLRHDFVMSGQRIIVEYSANALESNSVTFGAIVGRVRPDGTVEYTSDGTPVICSSVAHDCVVEANIVRP